MEFNDAALLKRQFCVVVFCQHSVDLQLFVLIVFAHCRSTPMKWRGERSGHSAQGKMPSKGSPHHKGGSHTNGGISPRQGLSTIPRDAADTGPTQAGLREEQGRIAAK